MKCQASSGTTHDVLISKEISWKSYKEICSGEKKKVNLGYYGNWNSFKVENNVMVHISRKGADNIHGTYSIFSQEWEVLGKFFSLHNIEPEWLNCNGSYGFYDEELGGFTGCVGKV